MNQSFITRPDRIRNFTKRKMDYVNTSSMTNFTDYMHWKNVLISFVVCQMCYLYLKREEEEAYNPPDGPKSYPIIGNLSYIYNNKQIHLTLDDLSKKFGNIYGFSLGQYPAVVLSDYDLIHDALINKADVFSNRPMHVDFIKLTSKGKGVFMQNGPAWRELRHSASQAMRVLSGSNLQQLLQTEFTHALDVVEQHANKPLQLQNLLYKAIGNNICCILFGKRSEYDDPEYAQLLKHLYALFSQGGFANIFLYLPWYSAPLIPFMQPNLIGLMKGVFFIENYINSRLQQHKKSFDPNDMRSFTDFFLQRREQTSDELYSDAQICQVIMDVFFAGSETTCTTLLWSFLYLHKHPEVQQRCREEIFQAIGSERAPSYEDRAMLPYVEATLYEVQRIGNVTPLGVFHSTSEKAEFHGHTLPKNTMVLTNLYAIHMNPDLWCEPEKFNPSRFLDAQGKLSVPKEFMPFGIGRRACIGEHLAKMEMFLFLTSFLQRFSFTLEPESVLTDLSEAEFGMTLAPKPFSIIPTPM